MQVGQWLSDMWLYYEVTFAVYMLEPWEKALLHVCLLIIFVSTPFLDPRVLRCVWHRV